MLRGGLVLLLVADLLFCTLRFAHWLEFANNDGFAASSRSRGCGVVAIPQGQVDCEVRFLLGEQEEVFHKGDFIYAPGGTLHAFKGALPEPARVLVLDAPATAEGFFREVDREVKSPSDHSKIPEIGRRHQMRFHAPG